MSDAKIECTVQAEIVREYALPETDRVHGVTFDGASVWAATPRGLCALDPATGKVSRTLDVVADAGTAYDGRHLFQLADGVIQKIDPRTGVVVARVPSPCAKGSAGLAWAEGSLWVAHYREKKILRVDPSTGAVLHAIPTARFVTGVTFVDGELWHGTLENDQSELRHVSVDTGEVVEAIALPAGVAVSGLESDGGDLFYCGGAHTAKVRAVRRPRRARGR